jgi:o-succinylbenzoate---CoA ligase
MSLEAGIESRSFQLLHPLVTSRGAVTERASLFLELHDPESGCVGIGEAAPMESFGTESIAEAETALHATVAEIGGFPDSMEAISVLDDFFPRLAAFPAARFAVETALLDLLAMKNGIPLSWLLAGCETADRIPVNALIGDATLEETGRRVREALENGYSCLKMKVGARSLDEDVSRVKIVRSICGNDISIRLDANGAWTRDEALDALARFAEFDIEYIEQPVPADDIEGLKFLKDSSPVAIAADESAGTAEKARKLLDADAADVFIIKPMTDGSLLRCREFALSAIAAWKKVVFTTLIDSSVARGAVAQLAASIDDCLQWHHGLGTGSLLADDVDRDTIIGGMLVLTRQGKRKKEKFSAGRFQIAVVTRAENRLSPLLHQSVQSPLHLITVNWLSDTTRRNPERIALAAHGLYWKYSDLLRDAGKASIHLQEQYGIRSGDRIATLAGNTAEHVIVLHALMLLGAVSAPVPVRWTAAEIGAAWKRVRPKRIVSERRFNKLLNDAGIGESDIIQLEELTESSANAKQPVELTTLQKGEKSAIFQTEKVDATHPVCILFSSGTTDRPKAIPLTRGNFEASARASAANLGVNPDDNWLCTIPLYHVGGFSILARSAIYGTAMTLPGSLEARELLSTIRSERITIASFVPTMLERLFEADPEFDREHYPLLRAILLGGGPAGEQLFREAQLRGLPVLATYGLTEGCSQIATMTLPDAGRKIGSSGNALTGIRIEVRDDKCEPAPAGVSGDIWIAGDVITPGYLDEESSGNLFKDGWFMTGDIGRLDEDGFLYVDARREDLIVSGGENVSPHEVEQVLLTHPGIRDAAVRGIEDALWGQIVGAWVVFHDSPVPFDELESFCRARVAGYKLPRRWRAVEEIPRTTSGKINRREIPRD